MRSSRFSFLLLLFSVGVFLYYKTQPSPWRAFKRDVSKVFGLKNYEAPEITLPENDTVASDTKATDTTTETNAASLGQYLPKANYEIVNHRAYTLGYAEDYEQAAWVLHYLSPKAKTGREKRSNDFMPDPEVSTGSATPQDYSRSGYDRGHLCPAGDFRYDKDLQDETFYMSNMSPQVSEFNRGIWNDLEMKVRDWAASRRGLIVITGPILERGLVTIGRRNQVAVPKQYYKILFDPQTQQAIAFLFFNEESFDLIKSFAVSIDEIEQKTGIDFFAKLPDSVENSIEKNVDTDNWF